MDKEVTTATIVGLLMGVFGVNGWMGYKEKKKDEKPKQDSDISKINIDASVLLMTKFQDMMKENDARCSKLIKETEERCDERIRSMELTYIKRIGDLEELMREKDLKHAKEVQTLRVEIGKLSAELEKYTSLPNLENSNILDI